MRLSIRVLCFAAGVTAATLVPFVVSCVKIKGGCVGMSVSPDSFSAKIGKARTFKASVQGTPTDSCTFEFSDAGAGVLQDVGSENETRLVLTASTGIYVLRVTSVDDATRHCNVAVTVSNFGFAGSSPITISGISTDNFFGDVAIGGSGSHSFIGTTATSSENTVYTASFEFGSVVDNTIRRYTLSSLGGSTATAQYDLAASGATPSFLRTGPEGRPRMAADGQGNGYWLRAGQSDELARLRAGLAQGQTPNASDIVTFASLGIALDGRTDLTSDSAGNLYVLGELTGGITPIHALGFPTTANIIRIHDAFGSNPSATVFTPTPLTPLDDFAFVVDYQNRILVAMNDGVGSTGGQFFRLQSNGTLDPTFAPPALNRPIDVKVDAEGGIYAVENNPTAARILVLNELGMQVAEIPPAPGPGALSLQAVLGFAASSNGTLAIFDDEVGPTQPPANFVLVNPN